ncbi:hypothetical protein [Nocardia phage NBR1]|uniref:hypothetical protein n=1 Tax=Nocardia phage NBR1 TaxID=1109711 RepID=UPI00023EEDF4|nr:hypothetical protein NoPhNBR1_gp49 [Nocardia phage NBR1]AEV52262.1 hypothetical protein [Nocardia phage NBR1]
MEDITMATKRIDADLLAHLKDAADQIMGTRLEQLEADNRAQFVDNQGHRDALADDLLNDLARLLDRINDVVDLDEDLLAFTTREV